MTFFYPDISNVGNRGLSLEGGTVAVCAKASEGTTFKDPSFHTFKSQAETVKAHFFAYHWTWCEDPQTEAENAFNVVGPDIPLMWDVENVQVHQSVSGIVDLTRRYAALGGRASLVYLPRWYWKEIGSPDLSPLVHAGLQLVSSDYTGYADNGRGWQSYGNVTPYIWQYTNAEPYSGQHVDFNACRDTLGGFIAKVFPARPVSVPPSGGDPMLTHWTTVKQGDTGNKVRVAQGILLAHGYTVGSKNGLPDGNFGPITSVSTQALQRQFGISVDGEFGPHTLSVGLYGTDFA